VERVVILDKRGRVLIPVEVRRKLGIRGRSKLLLRVRDDGVIELIPLNKLYADVSRLFEVKFRGWCEESHEASRILEELMR